MLPQWENPAPGGIPEWLDKYGVASLLPGVSPLCHVRFFSKAFSISAGYTFLTPYAYYFTNRPFQIQATRINILEYSLKIHKCDTFFRTVEKSAFFHESLLRLEAFSHEEELLDSEQLVFRYQKRRLPIRQWTEIIC